MPKCPNGHRNPKNQELCAVCDALMVPTQPRSLSGRAWWAIVVTSIGAVVIVAAVLGVVGTKRSHPETSSTPIAADAAMRQWWSAAQEHFDALQNAVDDTRKGLVNQ